VKLVEIIPLKNSKVPIGLGKEDVDQFFGDSIARQLFYKTAESVLYIGGEQRPSRGKSGI
jgi:hypothetical protein